jgi:hypothetical protein
VPLLGPFRMVHIGHSKSSSQVCMHTNQLTMLDLLTKEPNEQGSHSQGFGRRDSRCARTGRSAVTGAPSATVAIASVGALASTAMTTLTLPPVPAQPGKYRGINAAVIDLISSGSCPSYTPVNARNGAAHGLCASS